MGSRAGFIVKRAGVATAYGSHWGASSIMDDIFWGPDQATEAFVAQEAMDELEDIDGGDEGTVLIDWDAKRLIWWASNCQLPVHQRLFNQLAAQNWPGWQIETARGHQGEILNYFGIDFDGEEEFDDQHRDEEEDEANDERFDDEDEYVIEQEMIVRPKTPQKPISDLEELQTGVWVAIRGDDGNWKDYFVAEYDADDILQVGPKWLESLPSDRSLGAPAPELVTVSGIVIDCQEKSIWRWQGTRYAETERQLMKSWPDFQFRDLENGWLGQVEITGRSPETLQANDRDILGWVVASLLGDASVNPREMISGIVGIAKGIRVGCLAITLIVGAVGSGLSYWLESAAAMVVIGVFFAVCLAAVVWGWRKSAAVISTFDATSSRSGFHKGMNVEEKRPVLSRALSGAGFPSLEELEAAGEVPDLHTWADDDDDDDEDV